ncbi:SET domain-containing protein [Amylocystis lapponica]|nr:SET domain-containing protein [Amylocystis lapponica]
MAQTNDELENVITFTAWLLDHGGHLDPTVHFHAVPSGFVLVAREDVASDTAVVSCPFSLAVTPEISKHALSDILHTDDFINWSERQLICSYICMHWVFGKARHAGSPTVLLHWPYINTLPAPEKLRTPLHFTETELLAFRGTNLYGATLSRRSEWQTEWEQCRAVIFASNPSWGSEFTWERYLTASTYLSSRAFPSTILSPSPSLISTPDAHPVLLPGIDALNHARGQPVSWVVFVPPTSAHGSTTSSISLVLRTPTPRGGELLNNYGPKPNAEFILGYGFALPNNPDDTIALKLGGSAAQGPMRWEVSRNAHGAEPVWSAVLDAVREDADNTENTAEDELCAADMLAEMTQNLLDRLPDGRTERMRPEVGVMLEYYLEGQRDILQSLLRFAQEKEQRALEAAHDAGFEVVEEEIEQDE